ncbi:MAG: RagB/SusD family nutrient uptake outer membrane protein [Prevotellaceae bacterium]|nr:RagB/SusD family nutrient uptake outer membrane protein [Prevotellaceae bacterium]
MKTISHYMMLGALAVASGVGIAACSLEEDNPGGFTKDKMALSETGYRSIVNNIYFSIERNFYGTANFSYFTEAESDLWTSKGNMTTTNSDYFWFYAGASANTSNGALTNLWNNAYDGIGSCNDAVALAYLSPLEDSVTSSWVAEARFMRAVYYFHIVEQFGAVTIAAELPEAPNYSPKKADPLTAYSEVIIPDLLYAFQWLGVGTDAQSTIPTKKSALGFLTKAYLQMTQYAAQADKATYANESLKYAKMLMDDAEANGATYGAYMYPSYAEVFAQENNLANREALWKHRWYSAANGHGSSNGAQNCNRLHELFYCNYTNFGALSNTVQSYKLNWGGNPPGSFMPTQHLLSLYVNNDNTLDPRFNHNFQLEWNANQAYTWNEGDASKFEKNSSIAGTSLSVGDLAIKIIMPQDPSYATEKASRANNPYLLVDYADVYDDATKKVKMTHINAISSLPETENHYRFFYPSLTKFNNHQNYYVVNANNYRNANLNNVFMMRMAEVYLLAAEADIIANGGGNALQYINKVRTRAGAQPLAGAVTLRTILDERGRELCGEDTRFYDLKRTGMFNDASYLTATHPELATYFKKEYTVRPFPKAYIDVINNGDEYQNPGYN